MTSTMKLGGVDVLALVVDALKRRWAVVLQHDGNGVPTLVRWREVQCTEGYAERFSIEECFDPDGRLCEVA